MKCAAFTTKYATMVFLAVGLLLSTGCTKEEVVAPSDFQPELRRNAPVPPPVGHGDVTGAGDRDGGVFITDDGDDLGDKESTNKPKPN